MPRLVSAIALVVLITLGGAGGPAHAERSTRAKWRGGPSSVYVKGRRIWTGSRGDRVVSRVRWSKRGDAVAFAVRRRTGGDQLVVVLLSPDAEPHVMRWSIPVSEEALERAGARRPAVTWVGQQRVAYGPSEMRPTVVASWSVR